MGSIPMVMGIDIFGTMLAFVLVKFQHALECWKDFSLA